MNRIGIVCEYNPLHNGHLYHIKESRKMLGEDALIICVMSGDFVQRGEAAIFSKFARAEAACRCGADIVVELPLPWCLSSAEKYASGAVDILASMGCTHISFGSECGDIRLLTELAELLLDERINSRICSAVRENAEIPYAQARQDILRAAAGETAGLLSDANNILAVEYIKAVRKNHPGLIPITVKRTGSGHDRTGNSGPKSASELRKMIMNGENMEAFIPPAALAVYEKEMQSGRMYSRPVLDTAVLSRLRMLDAAVFEALPDGGGGAGRRLYKAIRGESGMDEIISAASNKKYTYARIRRMALCAALGICAECTKTAPPYARLLAATENGRVHLKKMSGMFAIPLITKPASVKASDEKTVRIFGICADAHDLYTMQFVTNDDKKPGEDWRNGPIIV